MLVVNISLNFFPFFCLKKEKGTDASYQEKPSSNV